MLVRNSGVMHIARLKSSGRVRETEIATSSLACHANNIIPYLLHHFVLQA